MSKTFKGRARIRSANREKTPEEKMQEQAKQSKRITEYPNVPQSVLDKNSAADNKSDALNTAIAVKNENETAFHNAVSATNRSERDFDNSRTFLAEEIEVSYNYDHKVYEDLGYEWYWEGPGEGITSLGQVTNVNTFGLTDGSFKVTFKGVDGDPMYEYYYTTGDPNKEEDYKYLGVSKKCSKVFINQLGGAKMWIKVRAVKDDFEDGAWSKPCYVRVP